MTPLRCLGADGIERTFYVAGPSTDGNATIFRVYETEHQRGESFLLRLVPFASGALRVEFIGQEPRLPWAARRGIPDAILPYAATHLNTDIVSSSCTKKGDDFLIPAAGKAWERLVAAGVAFYQPELHRFVLPCGGTRFISETNR